jgi:hypothetical protein
MGQGGHPEIVLRLRHETMPSSFRACSPSETSFE